MKALECRESRSEAIRPEQPIGSPALAQGDLKGKTLLVVEDEAVLLECEVQILGSSGCRVLQAECVTEALRLTAATAPIHLLLTDFSLRTAMALISRIGSACSIHERQSSWFPVP